MKLSFSRQFLIALFATVAGFAQEPPPDPNTPPPAARGPRGARGGGRGPSAEIALKAAASDPQLAAGPVQPT